MVDLTEFISNLSDASSTEELGKKIADSFHRTGILIVKDPRVSEQDNSAFIDMMETYYDQDDSVKSRDARPDIHFQVWCGCRR